MVIGGELLPICNAFLVTRVKKTNKNERRILYFMKKKTQIMEDGAVLVNKGKVCAVVFRYTD